MGRKLMTSVLGRRMKYKDAVTYANTHLHERWVVVQNADIVIGHGFNIVDHAQDIADDLRPGAKSSDVVWLLSRRSFPRGETGVVAEECCARPFPNCHDALVFQPPLFEDRYEAIDFVPNTWNAENVVAYEVVKAGKILANPCLHEAAATYHV